MSGSTSRQGRFDCLVALHNSEPATSKLVAVTRGLGESSMTSALLMLIVDGLATRQKIDPYSDAPLTDEELQYRRRPAGKRPYVYSLTMVGRIAAAHLSAAYGILERHEQMTKRTNNAPPANDDHLPSLLRQQAE